MSGPSRGWWVVGAGLRPSRSCGGCRAACLPPKGSLPKNGMLDRSMSTLIAPSRVAARTTLTSQVLSDWPDLAASSSALVLTDSGIRSVIRAQAALLVVLAGHRRGGGRGRGRDVAGGVHHEVEVAAVEPDVDAAAGQLGRDLGGGLRDGLHQRQSGGRVDGVAEPLRGLPRLGPGALGGGQQVPLEGVDVGGDVHVHQHDITVMSCQGVRDIISASGGVRVCLPRSGRLPGAGSEGRTPGRPGVPPLRGRCNGHERSGTTPKSGSQVEQGGALVDRDAGLGGVGLAARLRGGRVLARVGGLLRRLGGLVVGVEDGLRVLVRRGRVAEVEERDVVREVRRDPGSGGAAGAASGAVSAAGAGAGACSAAGAGSGCGEVEERGALGDRAADGRLPTRLRPAPRSGFGRRLRGWPSTRLPAPECRTARCPRRTANRRRRRPVRAPARAPAGSRASAPSRSSRGVEQRGGVVEQRAGLPRRGRFRSRVPGRSLPRASPTWTPRRRTGSRRAAPWPPRSRRRSPRSRARPPEALGCGGRRGGPGAPVTAAGSAVAETPFTEASSIWATSRTSTSSRASPRDCCGGEPVVEHHPAERAADGDLVGAGGDGLAGAVLVDPLADPLLHPHPRAAGAAAEGPFGGSLHLDVLGAGQHLEQLARRAVHLVVPARGSTGRGR